MLVVAAATICACMFKWTAGSMWSCWSPNLIVGEVDARGSVRPVGGIECDGQSVRCKSPYDCKL